MRLLEKRYVSAGVGVSRKPPCSLMKNSFPVTETLSVGGLLVSTTVKKFVSSPKNLVSFASEVGAVAFFLVVTSWYWRIDQHVVYLVVLFLSLSRLINSASGLTWRGLVGIPLVLYMALLSWIAVSSFWSDFFLLSISYAALVVTVGVTSVALGATVGLRRAIQGVFVGTLLLVLHSLFLALGDNRSGFPKYEIGLFTNRSDFSFFLALGLLSLLFLFRPGLKNMAWWAPLVIAYSILVVRVDILTAIFSVLGAAIVAGIVIQLRRASAGRRVLAAWGYPTVGLSLVGIGWYFRGPLLKPFGEDEGLAGRIEHWDNYFSVFLWRPFIGMGWGSSPGGGDLSPDTSVPVTNWFPAHNGFIDMGIMTGGVGVLLLVGSLLALFAVGVSRTLDKSFSVYYSFLPSLVTYLCLNDMMATSLPRVVGVFIVGLMVGAVLRKPMQPRGDQNELRVTQVSESVADSTTKIS